MIELKEITWENFWQVVELKLHENQREYLPSNAFSWLGLCKLEVQVS